MARVAMKRPLALFSSVVLLLASSFPAWGRDARLSNIVVTNTRDDLLVYLTVEGCFTTEMKQAVLTGVPITFSFYISLYRARNFWFDRRMSDITVTHSMKYDNLKKKFTVTRSWDPDRPVTTDSFAAAQRAMAEVNGLRIISLNRLEKGSPYKIRARAELNKVTLPLHLHYVFFFVSLWDFKTDWYTIDFYL